MLLKLIKWSGMLLAILFCLLMIAGAAYYYQISKDLPEISSLRDYHPPVITTVYSDNGRKIAEFYKFRRVILPLSEIPEQLINAFVDAEDARFFQHTGIDIISVVRAFMKNITAGEIVQGGSTITQQVAKSFFLSSERTYTRKIREAILSYRIEKRFSKEDILFLYLNQIYLGHGAYGVQAAAENYFGKTVGELTLAECALLAGLPQAPSRYSPFRSPAQARKRQLYVLNQMVERGHITQREAEAARDTQLDVKPVKSWFQAMTPWYSEYIRQYVMERYGEDMLYNQGLEIHAAVNVSMQEIAREKIEEGLRELDKRQGYRGPLKHLSIQEIEPFLSRLAAARDNEDADEPKDLTGSIVKGVVIDVNDTEKTVLVRFAGGRGRIPLTNMTWARKPDPEVAWYRPYAAIKKPSQALSVGDVIWVKINGLRQTEEKKPVTTATTPGTISEEPLEADNAVAESTEKAAPPANKDIDYDISLEQTPLVESALICMEAGTGQVKAMVGGRDFSQSQFNRAIQARRQPGSAFKPIIYAAALDKGYTPASMILDSAIVFEDKEHDFTWKPHNYEERFFGPTLFRKALIKSHNIPTIKILRDIGVDYVINYAQKLGITSPLSRNLSIALGSSGMSPLELITAYSVFANLGERVTPVFITKIVDRDGQILEQNSPDPVRVIGKDTAFIMTHLLQGVVEQGTGRRVRALNRPVAGKTGTTDNLNDAWFVGYTPDYVTAVWVGYDKEKTLGASETGASAASPIWLAFMQSILEGKPVQSFSVPEGVVFSKIDTETGLLPIAESRETFFECFKEGTVPTEHTPKPGTVIRDEQFFKKGM